jgi:RHS repeat-associated protein
VAAESTYTYLYGYSYTWQAGRELAGISGNGLTATYKYDADGIRTEKTVNGVTTGYTLEGADVVFETNGTDSIWYTYDGSGSLVSMELNGAKYYYVFNLQGDVVGLTDGTGAKVVSYVYDSWGKIISTTGIMASTVGVKNPYRYRGYRYDSETGLYYLQSRYYDAGMGRFVNADVYVDTGNSVLSTNMFAYCENNPVNMSDPNGDIAANVVGAVVGAVIGAVGGYFLSKWLADKLKLKGWKRNVFIAGLTAVVTASAAAIGYFVGPYVAKCWGVLKSKLAELAYTRGSPSQIGKIGEKISGIVKNTKKFFINGNYRIPDGINKSKRILQEVKNVKKLSLTKQIKDFMQLSKQLGYRMELYIRPNTYLSKPLKEAIKNYNVIIKYLW